MSDRRPTIREVAARAGVSIGTVSNVLTGRRGVRADKRASILEAIDTLGFVPDTAARSLIARRVRPRPPADPSTPRLTCVGYVCADHTAQVTVLPHRDDRATALAIEKTLGGCAANVAVTAAGLGAPCPVAADVMTLLGDDPDSDWAASLLADRGVALTSGSRKPGARLSRCIIMVEANGARTIINEPLQVPPEDLQAWLDGLEPSGPRHVLHLQGDQIGPLAPLLPQARARGLGLATHTTHLARAWRSPGKLAELCRLFDVVVLNREVARESTGATGGTADLVRSLRPYADGAPEEVLLILTLGPEGAVLLRRGAEPVHAAAAATRPVDTTGAGDTFTGCFMAAWANAMPPAEALRIAVAGASRSIETLGAQEHGLRAVDLVDSTALAATTI
ncbi:MAG: PfkB family carbohydrate kinase [Geminicoccaceae bacterium]